MKKIFESINLDIQEVADFIEENGLEFICNDKMQVEASDEDFQLLIARFPEIDYVEAEETTNSPKVMTWEEYNNSLQNAYLDEENSADQDVVFSNDTYIIRMFKAISHDNDHYFTGEDEDFAIIESKDGSFDSYLLYGCTLSEAIYYIKAASD